MTNRQEAFLTQLWDCAGAHSKSYKYYLLLCENVSDGDDVYVAAIKAATALGLLQVKWPND